MIIITDVHGCFDTLQALLKKLPQDEIVLAGDLVDRGPKSAQVIQWAIDNNIKCVKGNHEAMMQNGDEDENWIGYNGGKETMLSYDTREKFKEHCEWLKSLPTYLKFEDIKNEDGRYLLVTHSGLYKIADQCKLDTALNKLTKNGDIYWHRDPIHDYKEVYQVFGHTPQPNGPRIEKHFANLDTGCVFKREKYGVLTAMQFPSMQIFTQENIDNGCW